MASNYLCYQHMHTPLFEDSCQWEINWKWSLNVFDDNSIIAGDFPILALTHYLAFSGFQVTSALSRTPQNPLVAWSFTPTVKQSRWTELDLGPGRELNKTPRKYNNSISNLIITWLFYSGGRSLAGSASTRGDRTPGQAMTPLHGSKTPMYGSQTPQYDGSRTPYHGSQTPQHESGSMTPGRSSAWDPANPNTPSRYGKESF